VALHRHAAVPHGPALPEVAAAVAAAGTSACMAPTQLCQPLLPWWACGVMWEPLEAGHQLAASLAAPGFEQPWAAHPDSQTHRPAAELPPQQGTAWGSAAAPAGRGGASALHVNMRHQVVKRGGNTGDMQTVMLCMQHTFCPQRC